VPLATELQCSKIVHLFEHLVGRWKAEFASYLGLRANPEVDLHRVIDVSDLYTTAVHLSEEFAPLIGIIEYTRRISD